MATINILKKQKEFKQSTIFLAVCDITGITISLNIPTIPNYVMEYKNPLADIQNAKDLAFRDYEELKLLSSEVLAGILLSILTHYNVIEDRMSAVERNILLQQIHKHYLIEGIKLFSLIGKKRFQDIPHISLNDTDENKESKMLQKIKNYIKVTREALEPAPRAKNTEFIPMDRSKGKSVSLKSDISDIKKQGKLLMFILFSTGEIKEQFYSFLKNIFVNDNLQTMDIAVKNKVIAKLQALATKESLELATLMLASEKKITVEEDMKRRDSNILFQEVISSSVPSLSTRKTLKEIIEAKKEANKARLDNLFQDNNSTSNPDEF